MIFTLSAIALSNARYFHPSRPTLLYGLLAMFSIFIPPLLPLFPMAMFSYLLDMYTQQLALLVTFAIITLATIVTALLLAQLGPAAVCIFFASDLALFFLYKNLSHHGPWTPNPGPGSGAGFFNWTSNSRTGSGAGFFNRASNPSNSYFRPEPNRNPEIITSWLSSRLPSGLSRTGHSRKNSRPTPTVHVDLNHGSFVSNHALNTMVTPRGDSRWSFFGWLTRRRLSPMRNSRTHSSPPSQKAFYPTT